MSLSRVAIVLSIVAALDGGLHYFIWARLVRDPELGPPYARVALGVLLLFALLIPLAFILGRVLPHSITSPLFWLVYVWLGLAFFLFVLLLPAEGVRLVARLVSRPVDPERRVFLSRTLATLVGAGALVTSGAALFHGLRDVPLKRVRIPLAKLPKALSGYTIVQLTDIHVGPTIGRAFIEQLVERTNALRPDLVAITGDLVDGSVEQLGSFVEPLRKLRARDGVFFVTGNHEYYSGADEWIAHLGTLGIRVLRNERISLRGDEGLDIAGVDDASASQFGGDHGMDVGKALRDRDASRVLVLLAHQPKAIFAAARGAVDVQLSGHTHGGQMFPFNYFVKLDQPYVSGLHAHEKTMIYVSQGTGYWGPPMRLGAPPEITVIELVSV